MISSVTMLMVSAGLALNLASASPVAQPQVTPAPDLAKRATCTFTGSNGALQASQSKSGCATIVLSDISVPSGTTLDLTKLNDNTHVIFEGTTLFGYELWNGPLVSVSGNKITVTGAPGHVLDGQGSRWWDGQGSNGGKTKPSFFAAHSLTSSTISNINIMNTPVQVFSIDGANNLNVNNVTINNKAGDSQGGHNTDGFDVGDSTGVTITGAVVYNQDDCLAVNSGSDITFTGGYCSGGHGLSIGSVGGRSDNTVNTVNIENSQVVNSVNGIRIKTVSGATGSVQGVTYKNVQLSGITQYGVVIEQDYENGSPTGNPTGGVPITGLTVQGVTGTVASSATDVYILCASGACSNWTWSGNAITGGKRSGACKNVPSPASC